MSADGDGGGGRENRLPRTMQGLYNYVVAASDNPGQPVAPSQMNAQDQEFLSQALDAFDSDPVQHMQKCLAVLQTADTSPEGVENKLIALEEITELCNHIDFASDFPKIGGFPTLKCFLEHENVNLRIAALELVGTLVQNNPYCQKMVLEADMVPILLHNVDQHPNPAVRSKALFATSCLARDVPEAQEAFTKSDGFSVLMRAMQSNEERLKTKAAFMLGAMCRSQPDLKDTLVDMGMVEQLVGLLGEEHSQFHEHLMSALLSLVTDHPRALEECQRPELELVPLLRNRVASLAGKEESQEEREYAESLLQLITSGSDTETAR